jgi:hypothetical protein
MMHSSNQLQQQSTTSSDHRQLHQQSTITSSNYSIKQLVPQQATSNYINKQLQSSKQLQQQSTTVSKHIKQPLQARSAAITTLSNYINQLHNNRLQQQATTLSKITASKNTSRKTPIGQMLILHPASSQGRVNARRCLVPAEACQLPCIIFVND